MSKSLRIKMLKIRRMTELGVRSKSLKSMWLKILTRTRMTLMFNSPSQLRGQKRSLGLIHRCFLKKDPSLKYQSGSERNTWCLEFTRTPYTADLTFRLIGGITSISISVTSKSSDTPSKTTDLESFQIPKT